MNFVLIVLAILQIVGGLLVSLAAQSSIHEILAAILFGFGVLTAAMVKVVMAIEWSATRS